MVIEVASTSEIVPEGAPVGGASRMPVTEAVVPTVSAANSAVLGMGPISTNTTAPEAGVNRKPFPTPAALVEEAAPHGR